VTLKIERTIDERRTVLKLIGRISSEHLSELNRESRTGGPTVVLDLEEVSLVNLEVVRFLSACESQGIQLLNCSAFIRKWIDEEREVARKK
jgi:anti-anti-sigma regulatory factor